MSDEHNFATEQQPMLIRLLPKLLEQLSEEERQQAEEWMKHDENRCIGVANYYPYPTPYVIMNW